MTTKFNRFWTAYPKKKAKGNVRKWFEKHKPPIELVETMLAAIEQQKQSVDWQKDGGQFIPYPYSWLNAEMWEDGVDLVRQPEIHRAEAIEVKQHQKQRDLYTEYITYEPLDLLRMWANTPCNHHLAWLVKELRPEIINPLTKR